MSILTRWLLIPPVNARLIGRYRDYRRHGASAFSAIIVATVRRLSARRSAVSG